MTKWIKTNLDLLKNYSIRNITLALLGIVGFIFIYFLINTLISGYDFWHLKHLDFPATGQFGDFVGGFIGTIINGAAFYYLYLTLNEQIKLSKKADSDSELNGFETKFRDLVNLHRANIDELRYTKFDRGELKTAKCRKVFRVIIGEFIECYHEVKRFSILYPDVQIFKPQYLETLSNIKNENQCKVSVEDLAYIDIAFSFFYFGVSKESETVLLHKFYNRYNRHFIGTLKVFLQLKPKEEKKKAFKNWKRYMKKTAEEKREIFEDIYRANQKPNRFSVSNDNQKLYKNLRHYKYYGGHQHRLGHYLRHLFQSYKFISSQTFLGPEEKYFYGKTLRAQLSTYEQFVLFFNSLSSLGMKWEYTFEKENLPENTIADDFKLITRYNIIKNLPGSQYYEFKYKKFYQNVMYEFKDDITYSRVE